MGTSFVALGVIVEAGVDVGTSGRWLERSLLDNKLDSTVGLDWLDEADETGAVDTRGLDTVGEIVIIV